MFLYGNCLIKEQLMNMMICSRRVQFDRLFESKAESTAECGAYFTVVVFTQSQQVISKRGQQGQFQC